MTIAIPNVIFVEHPKDLKPCSDHPGDWISHAGYDKKPEVSFIMVDWLNAPRDFPTTTLQFTKNSQLDVYPEVDPSAPANSLSGKVVIITGASHGIGSEVSVAATTLHTVRI